MAILPGELTNPSSINQVAPNQRTVDWPKISNIPAPFGQANSRTFGFWFNYFWSEAIKNPALTQAQKVKLGEMYSAVFQNDGALRPDFATQSNHWKQNVLLQILLIGFRRVDTENLAPPVKPQPTGATPNRLFPNGMPLKASNAKDLNLEMVMGTGNIHRPIAYRSDSRSFEDLTSGFQARARSYNSPIHANYGLDQPWHPYNIPLYQNSLWLRLGATNKDNCLHTVISVGPSFAGITHFPILNDATVFTAKSSTPSHTRENQFLAFKPFDEWTPADIQAAASDFQKVNAVLDSNNQVQFIYKTNHVHVFHLTGIVGFNTEDYFTGSDKFPERGMSEVPVSHLLADLTFRQYYWYNPAERQIKLYRILFDPVRWVPDQDTVDKILGESGRLRLLALIEKQIDAAQTRSDVTSETEAFTTWRMKKNEYLTGAEKIQIIAAIKKYLDTAKPKIPSGAKERASVITDYPNLKTKIDAVNVEDWGKFKKIALLPA